jgi:hypothetical protein
MANITRNTFDPEKGRVKVTIQRGQAALLDSELNEMQDILRVQAAEGLTGGVSARLAADSGVSALLDSDNAAGPGFRFGYAARPGECTPTLENAVGFDTIYLEAGRLFVDGFPLYFPAKTNLGVAKAETVGAGYTYGYVYADIVFAEIDAGADPSIATPQLGETSVREAVQCTWHWVEAATYALAFSGIAPLPTATDSRLWKGNTARIFIAKTVRTLAVSYLRSMLQPLQRVEQIFGKCARCTGADLKDGMLAWNAVTGKLIIGCASSVTDTTGIILKYGTLGVASGISFSKNTETVLNGTIGVPVRPDPAKGYALASTGLALGFFAPGSDTERQTSFLPVGAYSYTNKPCVISPLLSVIEQQPTVLATQLFGTDPGSFIICNRVDNDLVFFNGQVLRGDASGRWTFLDLGSEPSPYDAVVQSVPTGPVHLSGSDALERALAWSCSGEGAGDVGTGRHLRFHVKKGDYAFSRLTQTFGQDAELQADTFYAYDATATSLEITGDGKESTRVVVYNIPVGGRVDSEAAMLNLAAGYVKLTGIHFAQLAADAQALGLTLKIVAREVLIEDCLFSGPVHIVADALTIDGTSFGTAGKVTAALDVNLDYPIVPMHLVLEPRTAGRLVHRFNLKNCDFYAEDSYASACCASVILSDLGSKTLVNMHDCSFIYVDQAGKSPAAVHVDSEEGDINITHCQFRGAAGYGKTGAAAADALTTLEGQPFVKSATDNTKAVATAYVSCTRTRLPGSSLVVESCKFSFAAIANSISFHKYYTWGACILMQDGFTLDTCIVSGVYFRRNTLFMSSAYDNYANSAASVPLVWGFYAAPTILDAPPRLGYQHLQAEENTFDVGGGGATDDAEGGKVWRGFRGPDLNDWPAADNWNQDTPYLIGIILRNMAGVGFTFDDRSAYQVAVRGNSVSSSMSSVGSMAPWRGGVVLDNTADPYPEFLVICLDNADKVSITATRQAGEGGGGDAAIPTTVKGQFVAPVVCNNVIDAGYFDFSGYVLSVCRCFQPLVAQNVVYAKAPSGGDLGVHVDSLNGFATGNVVLATNSIRTTTAALYAANNMTIGSMGDIAATTATYTNEDNFDNAP